MQKMLKREMLLRFYTDRSKSLLQDIHDMFLVIYKVLSTSNT